MSISKGIGIGIGTCGGDHGTTSGMIFYRRFPRHLGVARKEGKQSPAGGTPPAEGRR